MKIFVIEVKESKQNNPFTKIIVETDSPHKARTVTCICAKEASENLGDYNTPECLWHSENLSSCTEYTGTEYQSNGKEGILFPLNLTREYKRIFQQ